MRTASIGLVLCLLLVWPLAAIAWEPEGGLSRLGRPSFGEIAGYGPEVRRAEETGRPTPSSLLWHTERVDVPRYFELMGQRSLALDAKGRPHIAYGGIYLYYAWSSGNIWYLEVVDTSPRVGASTSLALDSGGQPHISYFDWSNDDLKYARFDGTTWHIETVDSAGAVGAWTSLALDAGAHPHIGYCSFDPSNGWCEELRYAYFDGTSWLTETVDGAGDVGDCLSLALDASGRPHISYYDATNGDLKYAYYDGTTWFTETVDSVGNVGVFTSLALDADGRPHISYNGYNSGVKYAYYDGTAWHIEMVDNNGGLDTSLALDSGGHPHISYSAGNRVRYAHFDGTSWLIETVGNDAGLFTSLALDASDRPHIIYYFVSGYWHEVWELRHAYSDGTAWRIETVDNGWAVGGYTSLALDASGRPHIGYCFYDYWSNPKEVRYAHLEGTIWLVERVDSVGHVGECVSLALDSADHPHLSYYDITNGALKYARHDGTGWLIETVDGAGDVGMYTSLALDASDRPHVSYYDATNGDLKYAHFDGTAWYTETVDVAGDVGGYTSLALDTGGRPHISYYDASNGDLRYAYSEGTSWFTETVDSVGNVGQHTSLALDAGGHPHISYYDASNGDLKYAYYDGTGWLTETVDGVGNVGRYTSLALDAAGRPHISYCPYNPNRWTCDALKYAHYDGTAWHIETVDGPGDTGNFTSLALDGEGRPHISYSGWDGFVGDELKYTWGEECIPIAGVDIAGPNTLGVGETGHYTATYIPITATAPVILTWDNGTVGPTAVYSWTATGVYTLTVTATNPCGPAVRDAFTVTVVCRLVEGVEVAGPAVLEVGEAGWYTATYVPITATAPVILTWDNGTVGPTAAYSWTLPGLYTLTVTATNPCGPAVRDAFTVTVVCRPVEGVEVAGPAVLEVGEAGWYTATYVPITATAPVTLTWDNGTVGPTAAYSWTVAGVYTVTVTGTNRCGDEVVGRFPVRVIRLYRIYLPLVVSTLTPSPPTPSPKFGRGGWSRGVRSEGPNS